MNILYIGNIENPHSGGGVVNEMHIKVLQEISSDNLDYIEPLRNSFEGKITFGITNIFLNQLDQKLRNKKYDYVFVSISLLGRAVKYVKTKYPQIKIITFFHNIEHHYAKEYYKTRGVRAIPFGIFARIFEKMAVKYSDFTIVLNDRDAGLMRKIYGSSPDAVSPVCVFDRFNSGTPNTQKDIDYLFVGSAFFANIKGIQWFIDNVMPQLHGNLYIIGSGMEKVPFTNLSPRIHIYGFVKSLDEYYNRAKCVISPIFDGGGMKTKTAEALMYGKMIFGTAEAFEGYDINGLDCIILCSDAQDFIKSLNNYTYNEKSEQDARSLYLSKYSYQNKLRVFRSLIK